MRFICWLLFAFSFVLLIGASVAWAYGHNSTSQVGVVNYSWRGTHYRISIVGNRWFWDNGREIGLRHQQLRERQEAWHAAEKRTLEQCLSVSDAWEKAGSPKDGSLAAEKAALDHEWKVNYENLDTWPRGGPAPK